MTGVRRWAGNDLIELQQQPLQAIDAFFAQYGNCILKGCEVIPGASDNIYNITPGFVALAGTDQDNNETFKVVPFAGIEGITLPVYLTLAHSVIERPYTDGKVKPVAYDFRAAASSILPEDVPYLQISVTGGRQFVDAIRLTEKLDQTGNGRDVTVTFAQAAQRENVSSGEKLSVLWGKVCRWFTDLKAVAFSGKAADLTEDQTHRFFTDAERNKLNGIAENANRYVHPASHPANIVEQDSTHRFVSDTEKSAWNSKAAGTHTHKASEVNEETNKRFLTDAERTKINNTYAKTETYTRGEIDTKDTAILDAAKKYVMDRISDVISGSPAALDTLYEIANALNNDPNFATTIMAIINGKADRSHTHSKSQITDFPSSMPASDVYAWAKAAAKPTYTYSEVGAAAAGHNHDSVYQPKGSYAAANHNHDSAYAAKSHTHPADQISDTSAKVMMTAAERSKLAGIELIRGMILMWSGAVSAIPTGWHLCDGTNGTPNLRDRFVVGAGGAYSTGATGGSNSVTLTTAQLPSHTHTIGTNGGHSHTLKSGVYGDSLLVFPSNNQGGGKINDVRTTYETSTAGSHSHTATSTGGSSSHENRPPYYALAFIMKL